MGATVGVPKPTGSQPKLNCTQPAHSEGLEAKKALQHEPLAASQTLQEAGSHDSTAPGPPVGATVGDTVGDAVGDELK